MNSDRITLLELQLKRLEQKVDALEKKVSNSDFNEVFNQTFNDCYGNRIVTP